MYKKGWGLSPNSHYFPNPHYSPLVVKRSFQSKVDCSLGKFTQVNTSWVRSNESNVSTEGLWSCAQLMLKISKNWLQLPSTGRQRWGSLFSDFKMRYERCSGTCRQTSRWSTALIKLSPIRCKYFTYSYTRLPITHVYLLFVFISEKTQRIIYWNQLRRWTYWRSCSNMLHTRRLGRRI